MREAVIVSTARTGLAKSFRGSFNDTEAPAMGGHVVRAWFKPYVTLIWLGALLMAASGMLSLSDRRLRVGAPVDDPDAAVPGPERFERAAQLAGIDA